MLLDSFPNHSKVYTVKPLNVGLLTSILFVIGCSTFSASSSENIEVQEELSLPAVIKETSGLFCSANTVVTINDSGNTPEIFTLDIQGNITSSITLKIRNRDWEAITGDNDYFYVGDIGNNHGDRSDLKILKVSRSIQQLTSTIPVVYETNKPEDNSAYNHDYDAEALVSKGDELLLFTKSWNTQIMQIYRLDKDKPPKTLTPVKSVPDLPGIITGADWSAQMNSFLLVGYKIKTFGGFEPFLLVLDSDFNVTRIEQLAYGQVEGVCAHPSGEIWITQEGSGGKRAKLIKFKLQDKKGANP